MATAAPPATTSYQTEKNLASLISGDTTSALSTVDTLSSLKLLRDLAEHSENKADKKSIQQVIQVETRYLRTAIHALQNVPQIQAKFGQGLGAALSLASVLREKHAEKTYDHIITKALTGAGSLTGLETPLERATRLNKTGLLQPRSAM